MAMLTDVSPDERADSVVAAIRKFYNHLNAREFPDCHAMVSESVRLEYATYLDVMSRFVADACPVELTGVNVKIVCGPTLMCGEDDFAHGNGVLIDRHHKQHVTRELWVFESDGVWRTRTTGMIYPMAGWKQS